MQLHLADIFLGRLYCLAAWFCFTIGMFFIKRSRIDAVNMNVIRGLGDLALMHVQAKATKKPTFVSWKHSNWALFRTIFGSVSIVAMALASKLIKLSVYSVIGRLQTIVLTFLGIYFLGNKFDYRIILVVCVSLFGVSLVIAPTLYGFPPGKHGDLSLDWTPAEIAGCLLCIVNLVSESFSFIILTKMSGLVGPAQSIYFLNLGICWSNSILLSLSPRPFQFYWEEVPLYLGCIFSYHLGQIFYTESARKEKNVGIQGILQSSVVIYSLLIDILILGATVSLPNIAGCLIVICSSIYAILIREKK